MFPTDNVHDIYSILLTEICDVLEFSIKVFKRKEINQQSKNNLNI